MSHPQTGRTTRSYRAGDKVRVSRHYHWAKQAAGTVVVPDPAIEELAPVELRFHGEVSRAVRHVDGEHIHYAVQFDEPQFDSDGDGPYAGAEIDSDFLTLLSE